MNQTIFARFWYLSIPFFAGIVIAVTWANYRFAEQFPGGNDFLVHWSGTRALLVDGDSPYEDALARQIQDQVFGRPTRNGENEFRVTAPLYFMVVYLPYALISDFTLARALWMTTLEIALVGLAFLSLRLTRWKLGLWSLPFYLLFSIFWYHSFLPLITGDAVILIALWLAMGFQALKARRDELAGILLALTTIKPSAVLLILVFVMIWTLSYRRWAALFWMIASLAILSVVFGFFLPDWPLQNLRSIISSAGYLSAGTPAAIFSMLAPAAGKWIGWMLSGLVLVVLLVEWYLARGKDFNWFLWTACLTLVASQWSGTQTGPENFILLFLPLALVFAALEKRWGQSARLMNWFLLLILLAGPWVLFQETLTTGNPPSQFRFILFPLPFFLLVALYWVRWWAVRPRRLLIDSLRESEALE